MRISTVVVAAGKGTRLGAGKNKLLVEVGEKTILEHTLDKFEKNTLIDDIIIVVSAQDKPAVEEICNNYTKDIRIVEGSDTRTQSVYNGLQAVDPSCSIVLIHDGARPFVSDNIIKCCIDDVKIYGSAITAIPVTDTIKRANAQFMITETLERNDLYSVQTPQGFIYKDILAAYNKIEEGETFLDDSAVYEKYFGSSYITMGESTNIKVTFSDDIKLFFKE